MLKSIKVLAVAVLVLCVSVFAFAQEGEGGFDFGLSIGIGAETFDVNGDQVTYQMLRVSPDIAIGKFGIGLELTLHYLFAPDFEVRQEDWVPIGDDNILDVYLPKFKYVRYGFKGDPLYAKFGSIENGLLGNGFIMGGYDNTLFLPEKRIFGLSFDLDGALFNFPYIGIETFVGNLSQFDVMGFRTFIRPLAFTDIPVIKGLQVGGTVAFDRKPGLYDPSATGSEDPIIVYGGDIRLPILSTPVISLATFGDIAAMQIMDDTDRGVGGMVGFGGRLIGVINYGAQIRVLGEDFIPIYFDYAYDLFRYERYDDLTTDAISKYTGWLGSLGFAFFDDTLIFNASLDGPFTKPDPVDTANPLNYPHLNVVFIVGEGLIPNLSFEAIWDKRSIGAIQDLFRPEDAVIGARVNYSIGAAVLSLVYQLSYVPGGGWETKSGIESAIQLF